MGEEPTEPKHYQKIFERGIDPDVEDPQQCHSHSEVPDQWPALCEILDYQERVRSRARSLLQNEGALKDRRLAEALWIGFEHEAMHLETFLYMLLQSEKIFPPIGADPPDFAHMAWMAKKNKKPNSWFRIPEQTMTVGLDDSNDNVIPKDSFGWDNEKPQRTIAVHSFEAQARPITNGEYANYLQANSLRTYPASWVLVHPDQDHQIAKGITQAGPIAIEDFLGNFVVRTVFGNVPLDLAQDWPLIASYDEVASYAKWVDCRIPTFEEAKSVYLYADKLRENASKGPSNGRKDTTNGFINGFSANGVKSSLSEDSPVFRDLGECNIGFRHWHPVPVTPNGDRLAGQSEMGGVWEWTSTPLKAQDGFKAMEIYPGYTCELSPTISEASITDSSRQRTFSTESTTSSWAAPGRLFPELQAGRHCKSPWILTTEPR